MDNHDNAYIGKELELFQNAKNWKEYYGKIIAPYVHGRVLEVGAGIGGTTSHLIKLVNNYKNNNISKWVCLEPDLRLLEEIKGLCSTGKLPGYCETKQGYSHDLLSKYDQFDAILYMDVIEHIDDDSSELQTAYELLNKGGHVIILVPAHNHLYSPFDKAIGHYRRYNIDLLNHALPKALKQVKMVYLDSVGYLASLGNSLLLKQSTPSVKQIQFWDKILVKLSKNGVDKVTGYKLGKSLLYIGQK